MRTFQTRVLSLAACLFLLACGGTATPGATDDSPGEPRSTRDANVYCYSVCGDHICDINTEAYSCPQDCGSNTCGDRICCHENPTVCPQDCPYASNSCYFTPIDLTGEAPEHLVGEQELPSVTPSRICVPECGDDICDINTEAYSCPEDCGSNRCGDRVCCRENPTVCPQDCPYASNLCYITPRG
ncbi:hypothetical protein [Pyxidicoccus sp. MSG2]|uniref:hypothetical protein n=1 Tax=Pyxidicoccus sp. MSG2 TaxID=2996790 RepID=UPI00226E70B3|nr:hypothetical protein [Pyxidicoccus sp. MSG2]MCY1022897.1 hypothetical protein [Pyxidicoccus sp. MSG2]